MLTTNALAGVGALVGDPARAGMLVALMDGRALTAAELAAVAGVTPQTASSHLSQLVSAGLLAMERQGRHRYHRLATPAIARMVEGMMSVAVEPVAPAGRVARTGPRDLAMRHARTCYDHLAGRVAVAIADGMLTRGQIEFGQDGGELTPTGARFLEDRGVDLGPARRKGGRARMFCRPCLDWSERRPHIAGTVGALLLEHLRAKGWIRSVPGSRVVTVTPPGKRELTAIFGLDGELWQIAAS